MNNSHTINRDYFINLMLQGAEQVSSSLEAAKDYLTEHGVDADAIIKAGAAELFALTHKHLPAAQKSPKQVSRTRWSHPSVLLLMKESGNPDPMDEIRSRTRDVVVRAFEKGWQGPPYSPIELASIMGFRITPNDAIVDARIAPTKDSFEIEYNPFQIQNRINFSIAHEIAHTFFPDCAEATRNREQFPVENRQLERLCNAGAAEIQLPYAIFSHDANKAERSMKGLMALRDKYQASLESVFIRYTEVIDLPCAILIGIFQDNNRITIDYCKSSRSFPMELSDNIEIPQDSKVFECTSWGWTSEEPAEWSIFSGHGYYAYAAGISAYRRDDKPRVGVMIVPAKYVPQSKEAGKIVMEFGDATKPRHKGKTIIAQVVNTNAAMGRGFGLALAKNYPNTKTALQEWKKNKADFRLGASQLLKITPQLYIFQMLAQEGFISQHGVVMLKYPELRKCLINLRKAAQELNASIQMNPIGSGQAGGDWNIIIGMIHDELVNYDLKVTILFLPNTSSSARPRSSLSIFKEDSTWGTAK